MKLGFKDMFPLPISPIKWWLAPVVYFLSILILIIASSLGLPGAVAQNIPPVVYMLLVSWVPFLFIRPVLREHVGLITDGATSWLRIAVVTFVGYWALQLVAIIFESTSAEAAQSTVVFLKSLDIGKTVWHDCLLILSLTILAPLGEEALYRGLIFRGIRDGLTNLKLSSLTRWLRPDLILLLALLISAQVFASSHGGEGQDSQIVVLFLHGIIYALIYVCSGSLFAAVMAHAFNNTITLLQVVQTSSDISLTTPALWLVYASPILTLLILLMWQKIFPTNQESC